MTLLNRYDQVRLYTYHQYVDTRRMQRNGRVLAVPCTFMHSHEFLLSILRLHRGDVTGAIISRYGDWSTD